MSCQPITFNQSSAAPTDRLIRQVQCFCETCANKRIRWTSLSTKANHLKALSIQIHRKSNSISTLPTDHPVRISAEAQIKLWERQRQISKETTLSRLVPKSERRSNHNSGRRDVAGSSLNRKSQSGGEMLLGRDSRCRQRSVEMPPLDHRVDSGALGMGECDDGLGGGQGQEDQEEQDNEGNLRQESESRSDPRQMTEEAIQTLAPGAAPEPPRDNSDPPPNKHDRPSEIVPSSQSSHDKITEGEEEEEIVKLRREVASLYEQLHEFSGKFVDLHSEYLQSTKENFFETKELQGEVRELEKELRDANHRADRYRSELEKVKTEINSSSPNPSSSHSLCKPINASTLSDSEKGFLCFYRPNLKELQKGKQTRCLKEGEYFSKADRAYRFFPLGNQQPSNPYRVGAMIKDGVGLLSEGYGQIEFFNKICQKYPELHLCEGQWKPNSVFEAARHRRNASARPSRQRKMKLQKESQDQVGDEDQVPGQSIAGSQPWEEDSNFSSTTSRFQAPSIRTPFANSGSNSTSNAIRRTSTPGSLLQVGSESFSPSSSSVDQARFNQSGSNSDSPASALTNDLINSQI